MMKQHKYTIAVASIALLSLGFVAGREFVATAPASQENASVQAQAGGYPVSYSPEAERLSALTTPELRSMVEARSRDLSDLWEELRRTEAEEKLDYETVAFLESVVRERLSALDEAYGVLEARDELTPEDDASRLRDVDVASDRRALIVAREDRDWYAAYIDSGHPAHDPAERDQLAVLDAGVRMAEARLAESEARLMQEEHEAASLRAREAGADGDPG